MKLKNYISLLWIWLTTQLISLGQSYELTFWNKNLPETIYVYFSPKVSINGVTHFKLRIDSVKPQNLFYKQALKFKVWIILKTENNKFYNLVDYIYPWKNDWDTIFNGKLIVFGLKADKVEIILDTNFHTLVKKLNQAIEILSNFKYNYSDSILTQLNSLLNFLENFNDTINNSLITKRISYLYLKLAKLLDSLDSPNSSLIFLNKSLKLWQNNVSALIFGAELYLKLNQYLLSYNLLRKLKLLASDQQYIKASSLAKKLFNILYQKTKTCYQANDLQCALKFAIKADTISMLYMINNNNFEKLFDTIIKQTFTTKFYDFQIETNFKLINQKFNSILNFYSTYKNYLKDSLFIKATQLYLQKTLNSINTDIENQLYQQALNKIKQVETTCSKIQLIDCQTNFKLQMHKLQTSIYQSQIEKAAQFFEQKNYNQASFWLQSAEIFRQKNNLDTNYKWKYLSDTIQKIYILNQISKINALTSTGNLDTALLKAKKLFASKPKFYLDSIQKLYQLILKKYFLIKINTIQNYQEILNIEYQILKHNLTSDTNFISNFLNTLSNILPQDCYYKHKQYFLLFQQIDTLLKIKDYLTISDKIISFGKYYDTTCLLMFDTLANLESYISIPATYQILLNNFHTSILEKDYAQALTTLVAAIYFFKDKNLNIYGIEFFNLYEIITAQNLSFVLYSIDYMLEIDSITLAYKLIEFLRLNKLPAHKVKKQQKQLGYRLALRDFSTNTDLKPLDGVKLYASKNYWWYRYLAIAYLKQRSKMKTFKL